MFQASAGRKSPKLGVRRSLAAVAAALLALGGRSVVGLAAQAPPDTTDLSITKTGTPSAEAGDTLRYTLTVSNLGPGTARDVFVADTLPAGSRFVSASGGGIHSGGVVRWPVASSFGPSDPDRTYTLVLIAPGFSDNAPIAVFNVATVATSSFDTDPSNNVSRFRTIVEGRAPDLQIVKSAPDSVGGRDQFTYTLTVTNNGPVDALDVVVRDSLPSRGNVIAVSPGGTVTSGVVTWPTLSVFPAGAPALVYTVTYQAPAAPDTITNVAIVETSSPDRNPANNRSSVDTRVLDPPPPPPADLSIVKSGPDSVGSEDFYRYTLLVRNLGPATAVDVVVTDVLPRLGRFIAASSGGSRSGRTVTWPTIPSMTPGASVTYTVDYQAPTGPVTLLNTGIVSSSTPDPVPENDTSSVETRVPGISPQLDVAIEKSGPDSVAAGATFDYALVVRNVGTTLATNVLVSDTLPDSGSFVSASGGGSESGGVVTWPPIPSLAVGASRAFTVTFRAPTGGGSFTNTGVVATAGDTNPTNDTSSVTTLTTPPDEQTDVGIVKTGPATLPLGSNGTYTITVTNHGPETAVGVVVTDTLPPPGRVVFVGSNPAAIASPAGAPTLLTWPTIPALQPGEARTYTVTLNFPTLGTVTNTAAVKSVSPDRDPSNNVDRVSTQVPGPGPDVLVIEKEASRSEASIGDIVEYRLTVTASRTPDVKIVDVLARGFRYIGGSARIDGGTPFEPVESPAGTLTFPTYSVPPAPGERTITYRVLIGADAVLGDGINRVTVRSDSTGGIDHDSARVMVRETPFDDEGIIVGKVYLDCGCDAPLEQEEGEVGIPGVRVFLQDGSSVVTDSEGKYDFYGLSPRTWIVKVDRSTLPLPDSARLVPLTNRHGNDGSSVFVDLKRGELHRADFADRSGSAALRRVVEGRRVRAREQGILLDPQLTAAMPADQVSADMPFREFRPLLPDFSLSDRNTGLPAPAGTLGVPSGGGLAERAEQPLSEPESDAIAIDVDGGYRADGVTPVPVTVRLPGHAGTAVEVTLEASGGRWMRPDPNDPTGLAELTDLDALEPGIQTMVRPTGSEFRLIAPTEPGTVEVRASLDQVRTRSERVVFAPMLRPLIAAGLLEARLDLRSLTDGELGLTRDRFEDALRSFQVESDDGDVAAGARAALFVKGGIDVFGNGSPDTELTLRLDSEEDERSRLFRDIQPDQFYPVYGDASPREFDAQSKGRFFGQLQRGASFLRYGDFNTGLGSFGQTGSRALGQYSRTLNGAFQHFESGSVSLDAFASRDRFRQVVDEIPGQGISGPYPLSRSDGLVGSERVELVTRDRDQPAVVLRSEVLERFTDYTIEPLSGRIIFRRPIPSQDSEFNPVAIRVSYEVETGGDRFWVFGANGQVQFGSDDPSARGPRVEIGGGFVRDDHPTERFDLASVNATIELLEGTYLVGEFATTDSASVSSGDAGRVELRHSSRYVDGRVFYLATDRSFANPSSAFARGREELGFRGAARLPDGRTQLLGEYLITEDRFTSGRRRGGRVALERAFGRWLRAQLGMRFADETVAPATAQTSVVPDAVNAIGARVTAGLPFLPEGSIFGEFEQDISDSDQRRAVIGGDYRILNRARIYGRHELISSLSGPYGMHPDLERNTTVFGIAADYLTGQSVFSEYRARDAFQGRDAQAAIGLRNTWSIDEGVRLSTSLERVAPLEAGSEAATAVTGALELTHDPLWKATLRTEFYARGGTDNFLGSAGYARKLSTDWTFLGNTVFSTMLDGDRSFERTRLGLAYRQTERNRWSALGRYEHRWDENQDPDDFRGTRSAHVFSTHVNYQPDPDLILRAQWASKFATAESEGLSTSESAHLLGARGTLDLTDALDLGVIGRTLFAGSFERSRFGLGVEAGLLVADNLRLAAGYNVFGFRDDEFSEDEYTDRGFYVQLGFKFDEALFGWGRADRGPVDSIDCGCDLVLESDLHVSVAGPDTVRQATQAVYTITIENRGEASADGVRLSASVQGDIDVAGVSDSVSVVALAALAEGRVEWLLPQPVAPGATVTRRVTVVASCESAAAAFTLAGSVSTVTADRAGGDKSFSTSPSVAPGDCRIELGLAVVPTTDTAVEGDSLDVTITTSSLGTMTARSVVVTAELPADVDSVVALDGGEPLGGGRFQWRLGDLSTGQATAVRLRLFTVCRGQDRNWLLRASTSSMPAALAAEADTASARIRVTADPDCVPPPPRANLRATMVSGPTSVAEGSTVTWELLTEQVLGTLRNVTLSAEIPALATGVTATPPGEAVDGSIDWGVVAATLGPGQSVRRTLSFTIPTCAALGVNTFRIVAIAGTTTGETRRDDNTVRWPVTVTGPTCVPPTETDLAISIRGPLGIPPDTAWADSTLTFVVTTRNVSSVTAENVAVMARLLGGAALDGRVIGSGRTPRMRNDTLFWEALPSLEAGAPPQIDTLLVVVPRDPESDTARAFRTEVWVSTSTRETFFPNNEADTVTVPVLTPVSDSVPRDTTELAIDLRGPSVARPGELLPYSLLTSTESDTAAFAVDVTAERPPRVTFLPRAASGRSPGSAGSGGIFWRALPVLAARGQQPDSMFFEAPAGPDSFWVKAIVRTASPERGTHPNRDSIWVTITPDSLADLAVRIRPIAAAFDTVLFEIETWNQGNRTAQRAELFVTLPSGVDFLSASRGGSGPSVWTFWRGRTVRWWPRPPSLAPMDRIVDTLTVLVTDRPESVLDTLTLTLVATDSTATPESNYANNQHTSSIMVQITVTPDTCDCFTLAWWWWLLVLSFLLILWFLYRRRRYGRIFVPCFRPWTFLRRKEINGFIAELRHEHNRTFSRIRQIHDRIGGQPCADWDVTVDLMYAYRDVRSWESIYHLYRTCPPALRRKPKVRRLYAFALTREERREDAEYVLRKIIEERGPDPHTCGMLGRIVKDRWEEAWSCDREGRPARRELEKAIEAYRQGHEAGPDNPYPGVNAMTLSEFLPERPEWLDKLAEEVKKAAKEWATEFNYWIHATRAELAVLDGDGEAASASMDKAFSTRHVAWQVETTARNLRLIMEAWGGRGDGAPQWLVALVDRLEAQVEAESAGESEAPGVVPGLGARRDREPGKSEGRADDEEP